MESDQQYDLYSQPCEGEAEINMDGGQKVVHQYQEASNMVNSQVVLVDNQYDGTAVVTLNRPQKRNALSAALITDLNAALRALEGDDSVRAIVLTGSPGGPFSCTCKSLLGPGVTLLIKLTLPKPVPI